MVSMYLHHALREQKLLLGKWREFENLISIHGDAVFFASLPTTPTDIHKRYMLRLGSPLTQALTGKRAEIKPTSIEDEGGDGTKKGPGASCFSISDTAAALCEFCRGEETFIGTLHKIYHIMQKAAAT